jgi:hypothetical protein
MTGMPPEIWNAVHISGVELHSASEEIMAQVNEEKQEREPLATLGVAARNQSKKPDTPAPTEDQDTSYKPADLKAEQKDAADILSGNATGNKSKVDAAIDHHAKTDKRAE